MNKEVHDITVGDTLTPLNVQLKKKTTSGVYRPVNLTGLTVKFKMTDSAGGTVQSETVTGVTIDCYIDGKVSYDFASGNVSTAGTYYGWFIVYSGSEKDTYPADGRKLEIVIHTPA